jgi:superoxide reductase
MQNISQLFQTGDWKREKHVPAIESPLTVKFGEFFPVTVTIGKEIAHPNTTEHHIAWMEVYFLPKGEQYTYQIARFDFLAHGSSVKGPNTSSVYTSHEGTVRFKTEKPGTIFAVSYCNIHGLWQNSMEIEVEEMELPESEMAAVGKK